MNIGIIGPNDMKYLKEINKDAEIILLDLAKILAESGQEIVITPEKNSILEFVGQNYKKFNGKKVKEVVPLDDDYQNYLNVDLGEIISCSKWENQPSTLNKSCDLFICVGYGAMVMAEIGFSKYYNPKKIYIIKELITSAMPKEVNESLDLEYISIKDLKSKLLD